MYVRHGNIFIWSLILNPLQQVSPVTKTPIYLHPET